MSIPERPIPPPGRMIVEGSLPSFCPTCGSTQKHAWFGFGRVLGCIQPKCWNYYRWQSLRVGVNPPAGLYGGPTKPPAPPPPPPRIATTDDVRKIVREELERAGCGRSALQSGRMGPG